MGADTMGKPNRTVTVTIAGTELGLCFEAYELMELKRLSGRSVMSFISDMRPASGETNEDAVTRIADLAAVVPVIQAGLASSPEYAKLTDRELRMKLCKLIDQEAQKTGESVLTVAGLLALKVWPVFTSSLLPPGMSAEDAVNEMEGDKGPLAEPPGEANPPGTG